MEPMIAGSLAGFAATAPMTGVMLALHRQLPEEEQHSLPPRKITMKAAEQVGIKQKMDESERTAVTYIAHFGYGLGAGALYGSLSAHLPGSAAVKGASFGLAVWAVSYLGWIPAAGILPSATREPARRNALMIAAHIVWGAATGLLTERLSDRSAS